MLQVATPHDQHTPAMDDFEDDISELSSIASYPSSPGNISQGLLELGNASDIPDIDLGCDRSQVSSSLNYFYISHVYIS